MTRPAIVHDTLHDTVCDVSDAVRERLRGVIDPCCRDRGISVVDMGLVDDVRIDSVGHAQVSIMLTSGWCPFQVDLVGEITEAATSVPGVASADVRITLDRVWSPARMAATARERLRLLPDPKDAGGRDRYLAAHTDPRPLPLVATGGPTS